MPQAFIYHMLHIASGRQFAVKAEAIDRAQMLAAINRWNRLAPGKWQYWLDFDPVQPIEGAIHHVGKSQEVIQASLAL